MDSDLFYANRRSDFVAAVVILNLFIFVFFLYLLKLFHFFTEVKQRYVSLTEKYLYRIQTLLLIAEQNKAGN